QTLVANFDGKVPDTMEKLLTLPGIGRKTANLVLGDIFGQPAVVCDTHCIRLTNLMGLTTTKDPYKCELQLRELLPASESNNFCHRTVQHGRAVCVARRPKCNECCVRHLCDYGISVVN
ncbi:MAG: endonuclease III, partial [Hydrogenoanaerobacterium sp.]